MDAPPPWFTPRIARDTIRSVRPLAEHARGLFVELETTRAAPVRPEAPVEPRYFHLASRLFRLLARLETLGIDVRRVRQGILDFPSRRGGRAVLLCWQVGGPAVLHWQECGDRAGRRRRIDESGPWDDPPTMVNR